jgi:hypothetical protein
MRIAALMLAATGLAGCATIVEGTSENVTVETNPPGATCAVDRDGLRLGVVPATPGSIHLAKSADDLVITCARPGFAPTSIVQPAHFVYTTFGNVLAGGLIGVSVDAASGANYAYRSPVLIAMAPAPGGAPPAYMGAAYSMAAPPPIYPAPPSPAAFPAALPPVYARSPFPADNGGSVPDSFVGTLPPLPPPEY